ncbi:MAG: TRAP transporter substrate-binding protein [Aquisalimonadaceae bacterium]
MLQKHFISLIKPATKIVAVTTFMAVVSSLAQAQEPITLRLHHFLPPSAPMHEFLSDWADRVNDQSDNRLDVKVYPSMQLGGKPPALYDQVKNGQVDIGWAVPGYTINRFPKAEVFDIPLIGRSAEVTSQAGYAFFEKHLQDEFDDVRMINYFTNPPCMLNSQRRVKTPSDLQGMKIRASNRTVSAFFQAAGAQPMSIPVPAAPEALSRGVLEGITLPFEAAVSLRIEELTDYQISFNSANDEGFCTTSHVIVMNKDRYESLPEDLRKVIDDNSGLDEARQIGRFLDESDAKAIAAYEGNNEFFTIGPDEIDPWREVADQVTKDWIDDMNSRGYEGQALYEDAKELIEKYAGQ